MIDDEMVGWHQQFNGHEFEQALGVGDGQVNLACCSPWGSKESDTTERLNNSLLFSDGQVNLACCSPWGSKKSDTTERLNNSLLFSDRPWAKYFSFLLPWVLTSAHGIFIAMCGILIVVCGI